VDGFENSHFSKKKELFLKTLDFPFCKNIFIKRGLADFYKK
jgi:hypothetical protein